MFVKVCPDCEAKLAETALEVLAKKPSEVVRLHMDLFTNMMKPLDEKVQKEIVDRVIVWWMQ